MRSFFHGWRRKAGVTALVMACVIFVAWMWSRVAYSQWWFVSGNTQCRVTSLDGWLVWQWWDRSTEFTGGAIPGPLAECRHYDPKFWQFIGGDPLRVLMAPDTSTVWIRYDWPVLGLTFLSAYLILWKPRKAKASDQPAISNLISN